MQQSAFTIVTPLASDTVAELGSYLDAIGDDINRNPHLRFAELKDLHYASLVVIGAGTAEPCLLFEGNIDGPIERFLDHLVATAPNAIDTIYGHCLGYPSAGTADRPAVVRYLMSHDIGTNVFYIAWRGHTVSEICREEQLRQRICEFLDSEVAHRDLVGKSPQTIRCRIQSLVRDDPSLAWAVRPPPQSLLVRRGSQALKLSVVPTGLVLFGVIGAAFGRKKRRMKTLARVALCAKGALLAGTAYTLRSHEKADDRRDLARDPDWQAVYAQWSDNLERIVQRENVQGQNHLASVTEIKPGWFRLTVLKIVLRIVNLWAIFIDNKGVLSGISSIHFARWVITKDRKRLIFLSNFDGSWERYLTDFIDLGSQGLTAIWTNSDNDVGFPKTKWLAWEGARDEQRFKAYARYSQARTQAWYSAYPNLTVENIKNNMMIRAQLFAPLDESEVEAWLQRF